MSQANDQLLDILIVGAGPAGLMMACQLALHNITFKIIDIKSSKSIHSGALILHARTLEIFQQMGISEKVLEMGIISKNISIQFNYRKKITFDVTSFGEKLTPFPYMLMMEQWQTENILQEFIKEKGHYVEKQTSLIDFFQDDKMVISKICNPDGSTEIIKSKFLIGADGNESFVRKQLQIPFPGVSQDSRLFITDCEVSFPFSDRQIFFSFTNDVTSGFFPLKGTRWRVDGHIPLIDHHDVNFNDVVSILNNKSEGKIKLDHSTWFSVFRSHSRCADQFYNKRCFLIGDAAHVHSPVGAQGMNTGIQDAFNLSWKLAYFIQGKASEKLLSTYQAERRPLALNTISYTNTAYSFLTSNNFLVKFTRLCLLPLVLPKLFTWLKFNQKIRTRIFNAISGIGIKYKNSTIDNYNFNPKSPKPGERIPYITYETKNGQISLFKDMISTHFCLIILGGMIPPKPFLNVLERYENIISIKYINRESGTQLVYDKFGIKEVGYYLIRPDQYIAFRSHEFNADELKNYLQIFLI